MKNFKLLLAAVLLISSATAFAAEKMSDIASTIAIQCDDRKTLMAKLAQLEKESSRNNIHQAKDALLSLEKNLENRKTSSLVASVKAYKKANQHCSDEITDTWQKLNNIRLSKLTKDEKTVLHQNAYGICVRALETIDEEESRRNSIRNDLSACKKIRHTLREMGDLMPKFESFRRGFNSVCSLFKSNDKA